ncbi:MAG: sulfotransferase family 2 domain-containing protein [Chitinophagaceae bacterium]
MVISDKYKYLFIELYFTGSTAISSELCELYDGKKILSKHSRYHEFLKTATNEQKKYFVFSSIRNPMDVVVSGYLKFKNNHKGRYTNPKEWRINGGTISNKNLKMYEIIKNLSFEKYFKEFYKIPYDNWSTAAHNEFDFILRFENIQNDFREVLTKLNIEPKRELPQKNKTIGKEEDFTKYYTPEIRERAIFVFGPFMKKWGYSFPAEWNVKKVSSLSSALFTLLGAARKTYWRNTKTKSVPA